MQKIGFCDRYGLTKAILNGTKTMTRRVEKGLENLEEGNLINRPGVGSKGLWETNPFVVVYEFKLVK